MMISFQTYLHCLILLTTSTLFSDTLLLLLLHHLNIYLWLVETDLEPGVLYASTLFASESKALLQTAVKTFLAAATATATAAATAISDPVSASYAPVEPALLYSLYYAQSQDLTAARTSEGEYLFPDPSIDLAFDDGILERVEEAWRSVLGAEAADAVDDTAAFMVFEDRELYGGGDEDDDS